MAIEDAANAERNYDHEDATKDNKDGSPQGEQVTVKHLDGMPQESEVDDSNRVLNEDGEETANHEEEAKEEVNAEGEGEGSN